MTEQKEKRKPLGTGEVEQEGEKKSNYHHNEEREELQDNKRRELRKMKKDLEVGQ